MGPGKKAWSWARNKPDVAETMSQLRLLVKQLERERTKLEREERDTKARAIRARKSGRTEAFQFYATEMIRFRRLALSVDRSRLQMLKILAHLARAQTAAKASRAMEEVSKILGVLGKEISAEKVIENADEIARRLEEFEIETGITSTAFDSTMPDVTSEDLTAAMVEIDREIGVSEGGGSRPLTEAEKLEEDIKALEKELGF